MKLIGMALLMQTLAMAAELSPVEFAGLASDTPEQGKATITVHRFVDKPCELRWRVTAIPGTEVKLTGQVFLAATKLAIPLAELGFEITGKVPADEVMTSLTHTVKLEASDKPTRHIIKWQFGTNDAKARTGQGAIVVESSPRGLFAGLTPVYTNGAKELVPFIDALKKDGISADQIKPDEFTNAGLLFARVPENEMAALIKRPLAAGQCFVLFGHAPGMADSIIVKPSGQGRLVLMTASCLDRLADDPSVQQIITSLFPSP